MGNHGTIVAAKTNVSEVNLKVWVFFAVQSLSFPIARFSVLAFLLDLQGPTHRWGQIGLVVMCALGVSYVYIIGLQEGAKVNG